MYDFLVDSRRWKVNLWMHSRISILVLHVYGILLRHKLVLSLPALRILEEKLCEDGRKINDPNYELYHKDMLLDKNVMFHEYDPKNKKIRGRFIPKLPKKNIRRTLPRSRQDLKR